MALCRRSRAIDAAIRVLVVAVFPDVSSGAEPAYQLLGVRPKATLRLRPQNNLLAAKHIAPIFHKLLTAKQTKPSRKSQ